MAFLLGVGGPRAGPPAPRAGTPQGRLAGPARPPLRAVGGRRRAAPACARRGAAPCRSTPPTTRASSFEGST